MANQAPNLDSGLLRLSQLKLEAKQSLVEILDSQRGKKLLVIDQKVSGPLGLLAEISLFKEHGVELLQHLGVTPLEVGDVKSVIFLIRTRVENAQLVIQQVQHCLRSSRNLEFSVYFLPNKSGVCEKLFQEAGISANVSLGEFPLYFIPFDYDMLSLELDATFRDVMLEVDWSSSLHMAKAIMQLQRLYGRIHVMRGVGRAASAVADGLARLAADGATDTSMPGGCSIDEVILIDREVDCVTPLCTQLTYEGLLEETMGIKNGTVTLEKEGGVKQRIMVNSADSTYHYIRDRHIGAVGIWLNEQAKSFHSGYKGSKAAELKELKEFTSKLKSLPQIQRHIELLTAVQTATGRGSFKDRVSLEQEVLDQPTTEAACQALEEMMWREESMETVLRLMCLVSLTQGGIAKRLHDSLRREFLHTYGHQHILTFQNLQLAGLLRISKGGKPPFQVLKKALGLMVDGVDPKDPTDPAYVFSGYAPISVRLTQAALRSPAWSGLSEEALKLLPGQPFSKLLWGDGSKGLVPDTSKRRRVLVAFVGGVTYAEIAALRFLQSRNDINVDFVFATSKFIAGANFVGDFQDEEAMKASTKLSPNQ